MPLPFSSCVWERSVYKGSLRGARDDACNEESLENFPCITTAALKRIIQIMKLDLCVDPDKKNLIGLKSLLDWIHLVADGPKQIESK